MNPVNNSYTSERLQERIGRLLVGGNGVENPGESRMNLRPVNLLRYHVDNLPTDVAVDVGTSNTLIHGQGKGVIVEAPSVAVSDRDTGKAVTAGM